MKQFIDRLFSETPKFFRGIRNLAAMVSALSVFIISVETSGIEIPTWLSSVFEKGTAIGAALVALVAQLTKIWKDEEGEIINEVAFTVNPDKEYPDKKF